MKQAHSRPFKQGRLVTSLQELGIMLEGIARKHKFRSLALAKGTLFAVDKELRRLPEARREAVVSEVQAALAVWFADQEAIVRELAEKRKGREA